MPEYTAREALDRHEEEALLKERNPNRLKEYKKQFIESKAHLHVKLFAGIMFVLSLFALVILSVLKVDGLEPFADYSWLIIIAPSAGSAFIFLVIWMSVHYATYDTDIADVDEVAPGDEYVYEKFLETVVVGNIESFHEAKTLWDTLLTVAFVVMVGYGAIIYTQPCTGCNTPYALMALGLAVSYFARAVYRLVGCFYEYYRLRNMAGEVDHWQISRDDRRFFGEVVPDLAVTVFNWGLLFDLIMWALTLTLALFGSIWLYNGDCGETCSTMYSCTQALVFGVYGLEGTYILGGLVIAFYRRITAVEGLDRMVARIIHAHRRADKLKIQARLTKARDGVMPMIK